MEDKNLENAPEEEKGKKKRWLLLLLLLLLFLIISGVSIWAAYFKGGKTPTQSSTRIPPKIEAGAESIASDNSDKKLDAPKGGGAVSLTYSKEVDIDLTAKKAYLVFANPKKSIQDAVVQLVISDTVIMRSGSLTPGTRVTALDLAKGADEKLSAGTYNGKFVVSFYDRETDRWAKLNAEIPVFVTVK